MVFHYISDVLVSDAYAMSGFVRSLRVDPATSADPGWATVRLTVHEDDAYGVLNYLRFAEARVEAHRPRITRAFSDPTYAIAAAAIDRERGGGQSGTPVSYRV